MPSKLCSHINAVTDWDGSLGIIRAGAVALKILQDRPDFVRAALAENPNLLVVGRVHREPDDQRKLISAREKGAESFFRIVEGRSLFGLVKVWEGLNEIGPHPTEDYMRFELRLAELLHQAGMEYVAGSWSVGCPAIEDWQSDWMLEVLRVADHIGVHEYGAPDMATEFELYEDNPTFRARHDAQDPVPITPENGGFFTLRYRRWYPHLPEDCKKPLLITECGIDSGACPHGYEYLLGGKQGGWRNFATAGGYLSQLKWFDGITREDECVKAVFIYCDGTEDPRWDSYDIKGAMARFLGGYIAESQAQPSGYRSHYLLLPQGSPWELYEALKNYILKFRVTMGQSHDDSCKVHGNLGHTVTLINPDSGVEVAVRGLAPGADLDIFRGSVYEVTREFDRRAREGKRFG